MDLDGIFALTLFTSGFVSVALIGMDSKDSDQVLGQLSEKARTGPRAQWWDNLTARIRFVLGVAAVILCASALGANISTWFSTGIIRHRNPLIALDIGIGILIFASILIERWKWRMLGSKKQAFTFPRWTKAVLTALFIYVAFEFAFDVAHLYRQEKLSTPPNGVVKLEMTAEEQTLKEMRVVRGFSGVWILVSSVSAAGLLLIKSEPYKGPFGRFNRVVEQL